MAKVEEQCLEYTKCTVDISFPGYDVCCDRCPLLETYARKQCRRTGEYILDSRARGIWCPLSGFEVLDYGETK